MNVAEDRYVRFVLKAFEFLGYVNRSFILSAKYFAGFFLTLKKTNLVF